MSENADGPEGETRDFDGFGAAPNVPGQAESRAARVELDRWLTEQLEPPAWLTLWRELSEERAPVVGPDGELVTNARGEARTRARWTWRTALYIAWMATPKHQRQPKTVEELANLLGLASTGTIRNWRKKDPEIDKRIRELPTRMLVGHLVDVYAALVDVASSADPKAFNDRRLFLELVGEYRQKSAVVLAGDSENPVYVDLTRELKDLGDEDLDALARIAGRLHGDSGGAGATQAD